MMEWERTTISFDDEVYGLVSEIEQIVGLPNQLETCLLLFSIGFVRPDLYEVAATWRSPGSSKTRYSVGSLSSSSGVILPVLASLSSEFPGKSNNEIFQALVSVAAGWLSGKVSDAGGYLSISNIIDLIEE